MRLLDSVAVCRTPLLLTCAPHLAPFEVSGPSRFAARIAQCPLRFVLGDDLIPRQRGAGLRRWGAPGGLLGSTAPAGNAPVGGMER